MGKIYGGDPPPGWPWREIYAAHSGRMRRQVTDICWVAQALTPSQVGSRIEESLYGKISTFLRVYSGVEADRVITEFSEFRTRSNYFRPSMEGWKSAHDPFTFWNIVQITSVSALAVLARRIFQCLATSVPSERSFSMMKVVKPAHRNQMTTANLAKLVFCHMNSRTLAEKREKRDDVGITSFEREQDDQEASVGNMAENGLEEFGSF